LIRSIKLAITFYYSLRIFHLDRAWTHDMICPRSRSHRFANMTGLWHSLRKVEVLTTPWIRILIHSPTMFFALKNAISAKFVAIFKKSEQAQADNKLNPPKNRIREVVIGTGNPRVNFSDPYPYPSKPVPAVRVTGFRG
jgi:hypothetical protein